MFKIENFWSIFQWIHRCNTSVFGDRCCLKTYPDKYVIGAPLDVQVLAVLDLWSPRPVPKVLADVLVFVHGFRAWWANFWQQESEGGNKENRSKTSTSCQGLYEMFVPTSYSVTNIKLSLSYCCHQYHCSLFQSKLALANFVSLRPRYSIWVDLRFSYSSPLVTKASAFQNHYCCRILALVSR